ncbi:MAG: hypothetical protein RLZZ568_462 [Cyanobacteriota bacterium]|jgi:molybdopterin synthase sulfur carrier subunit
MPKHVTLKYFALLKDHTQIMSETLTTDHDTYQDLYQELAAKYHFPLSPQQIKIAVNDDFVHLTDAIADQAVIVFIPPVAGG